MRASRRGVCAAVVGLALMLTAVPASAGPGFEPPERISFAGLWQALGDYWTDLLAAGSPAATAEASVVPAAPGETVKQSCDPSCTEQSHDIDPNG